MAEPFHRERCDAGINSGRRDAFLNRAGGSNQKTTQSRTQLRGCFKPERIALLRLTRQDSCHALPGRQTKVLRWWLNWPQRCDGLCINGRTVVTAGTWDARCRPLNIHRRRRQAVATAARRGQSGLATSCSGSWYVITPAMAQGTSQRRGENHRDG